ncbi:ectonucleoside triphosphate diphosphohydrolase [Echinococcus multilocularis]|uniref:Ectonucleoside triphosphate diphosphohydrolase n=1 Tax=Echinococcus multilocularis TaxID=6211 RepID=A0A0S4MLZ0_ECHMU|nr:ectonucleoside triphosphate diphosphohydrolase [Echinococcus multilocularis]
MQEKGIEPNTQTTGRSSRCAMYILTAIILVCFVLSIIFFVIIMNKINHPVKHVLIIECGLNTSKLFLFQYGDWNGRSNASIRLRSYSQISAGITSLGDNATAGAEAIVKEAKAVMSRGVPADSRRNTRIFLGAVAGVRLLEKRNAEEVQALMAAVRKTVAGSELVGMVESARDDVRVVSDADEGFYEWLAVNYGMGNFGKADSEWPHSSQSVVGVVNLGDESTEMTLVVQREEAVHEGGMARMAFGHNYSLYSDSHLCYGVATIRARYLARLTEGADVHNAVVSPCHQDGISMEVACDDIFQVPCVTSAGEDIMGPSISKPSVAPAMIKFKGEYNASTCDRAIEAILANGFFTKVYRPRLRGDFAAIHKLWEIVTSFKQANQSVKVSQSEFGAAVDKFCTRDWASAGVGEQETAKDKCLEGWIVKELLEAYGFKSDRDWERVTFFGGVDESAVSWSTGYALDKTRARVPIYIGTFGGSSAGLIAGIVIISIFGVVIVITCILKCCECLLCCCDEPTPEQSANFASEHLAMPTNKPSARAFLYTPTKPNPRPSAVPTSQNPTLHATNTYAKPTPRNPAGPISQQCKPSPPRCTRM